MKGKLNLFQATMLRWRDLHPYNAVHVVRIDVPLDGARLRADIEQELARQGLTGFALDVARRRYEYTGGAAHVDLRRVAAGSNPRATVQAEIERELNAPFAREGRIEPFRFFAVDADASFQLGVAYDHVVAGGEAIVALLKCIVDRHCGSEAAPAEPPERYPPTYGRLFRRQAGFALRGLSSLRGTAASLRKSVRPRFPGGRDPRNAVALFRVHAQDFARFGGTAKAWGVTRNDLLIAILLAALSPFVGEARRGQRRHEIAVASIVNVRNDLLPGNDATFGQFLSSFRLSHPVPVGIPLRQLAQDIHAQTGRIKRGKLYLQTLLVMRIDSVLWRFLSPRRRAVFHAKSYPVWVGITPLDVSALWQRADGNASSPEYWRVVPTGPLAPLVVAATTDSAGLALGFSFRLAAFSREDIARMGADVLERIASLAP